MNIDNLHIGDVIKNYYALCDEIEEPIKSGKSKKYQLEDFMRYFTWEKSGHVLFLKRRNKIIWDIIGEKIIIITMWI